MDIHEDLTLGIDLGIGSCGWAVIRQDGETGEIVDWGTRTFDVPEDEKKTPTNQLRRGHRGLRRVLKRRRQRMNEIRALFKAHGLLNTDGKAALNKPSLDPWRLRAEGLDRKLSGEEFAVAIAHIAKHRGFKSNSKRKPNAAPEDSKMLKAIGETADKLAAYRTVGEMFFKDEAYAIRKHNRDGDYSRSVQRDDQEREVRLIFDRQRAAGNASASLELEQAFIDIAFFQRPLADSEDKVGFCPFEPEEKRAAKHAPSFEKFRFVSRLNTLRLQSFGGERALTAEEISAACADFGGQNGMTFKRLRKIILKTDDNVRFEGIPLEEEGKRDVASRSGNCMAGTATLREVLGGAWKTFNDAPDKLDRIAFTLTFREDPGSIRKGLGKIGLEPLVLEALMKGVEAGEFSDFKGAGHISAKACRAVLPFLMQGNVYDKAMALAGYIHTDRRSPDFEGGTFREKVKRQIAWFAADIANPVAKKSLIEALKQTAAIVQEHGLPEYIHVELARDVGKSKEERDKIYSGIEKRNAEKDRLIVQFRDEVGCEPRKGSDDLLRFELWKEQGGRCLYTDTYIDPRKVVATDNSVQVDHILPWSRSGDDSFFNKTLCLASANQKKRGQTPFEWFGKDEVRWQSFVERIETNKSMKGRKKRNYLIKDAKKIEEKFRPRNLNDTRYATRALLDALAQWYPNDGKLHVLARPGQLTDRLRRGWGVQHFKKIQEPDGEKRKADDRHHALDALIVAATSQSALMKLTKAFQEEEKKGGHRDFSNLPPPWLGFFDELDDKYVRLFVSRAERYRARGKAHEATIRQISERDGKTVVYERKSVEALKESDLRRIKDPERNAQLVENIRAWIADGNKKGTYPKSPKGDDIKKVRLGTNKKADVLIRDGAADRGEMVRVDVFRKKNKNGKWEFYLVPIYPHQVADKEDWPNPPNRIVQNGKDETEWTEITTDHQFMWSIYPLSFLEIEKPDGTFIDGYYRGMDRSTGAITVSAQYSKKSLYRSIGVKTLKTLVKYHVDRLGRKHPIEREVRTWHGEVCT